MGEAQLIRGRAKGRAGQAGRRQGAGHRAQGQGTEGRVGLQDSILRFSRPENPKITVLQLFEERGRDRRAGHASLACPRSLGVFRVYGLRSYRLNLARLSSGASGR